LRRIGFFFGGALKAPGASDGVDRDLHLPVGTTRRKAGIFAAAGAIAIAYFLAAGLGLALLSAPSDVAVFWPASGLAAGILIIFGRRARPALVIGVLAGTIAANLLSDRSLATSTLKGFCDAGEAVLVAWLLERWFGPAFAFDDVRHVLGLVAAAALGVAASALGGAATMTLLHTAAPFWDVWHAWFLASGVGIVVVAPLVIGLGQLWHERPSPGEWIESVGVLALLSVTTLYVVSHPAGSWVSFSPGALVLPFLLWLTARCRPTFAIAGAFVASAVVLFGTTFGIGRFGDASIAIAERVKGAQAAMMMVTLYTLILTALFTERRRNEAALKESERRFRLTADAAPVMVWISGIDKLCTWFNKPWLDFVGRTMEQELGNGWSENVHADDFDRCLKTYVDAFDARQPFSMEYRMSRHDGEYRWVLDNAIPLWEPAGEFAGYIGSCIDITERKQAEDHKDLLVAELDHRVKNALACVAAIAEQTRATSNSMDEFLEVLRGRIRSLANTHSLLSRNRWQGVDLAELVRRELASCMRDGNTLIDGPAIDVGADSVQIIAIVLHELTTNAAKYGAHSNGSGRISVRWHWQPDGGPPDGLVLEWFETGGPPVVAHSVLGYGTSVIRNLIPYELGGTVDYVLAADGVRCKLEIPAKWLRRRTSQRDGFNGAGEQLHASS
jgi:two-component system, sensor histidine kinase PdtaS